MAEDKSGRIPKQGDKIPQNGKKTPFEKGGVGSNPPPKSVSPGPPGSKKPESGNKW